MHIHRFIYWRRGLLLPLHVLTYDGIAGGFKDLIGLVAVKVLRGVVVRYLPVSHLFKCCLVHVSFLHVSNLLRFRVKAASANCWLRCSRCHDLYDLLLWRSQGQDWDKMPQQPACSQGNGVICHPLRARPASSPCCC